MARFLLLIEDDDAIRNALSQLLLLEGYQVLVAENGRVGLDLLLARAGSPEKPELIIVDWMMPVMDGLEFIDCIRRDERFAATPVILCTAQEQAQSRVSRLERVVLVRKPAEVDLLLQRIAENLP